MEEQPKKKPRKPRKSVPKKRICVEINIYEDGTDEVAVKQCTDPEAAVIVAMASVNNELYNALIQEFRHVLDPETFTQVLAVINASLEELKRSLQKKSSDPIIKPSKVFTRNKW